MKSIACAALVAACLASVPAGAQTASYYAREKLVPSNQAGAQTPAPTSQLDCHSTSVSTQGFSMTGGWTSYKEITARSMAESAAACESLKKAGSKYNLCVFYVDRNYAVLFTGEEGSAIQYGKATIAVQQTMCNRVQ